MFTLLLLIALSHADADVTYTSIGCTLSNVGNYYKKMQCNNLNLQGRLYINNVPNRVVQMDFSNNNLTSIDKRTITLLNRATRGIINLENNPYFTTLPTNFVPEELTMNPPSDQRTYSSTLSGECALPRLDSEGAWCSTSATNGSMTIDLGLPMNVVGAITQGRKNAAAQWVTKYTVHSNYDDSSVWKQKGSEFIGNNDRNTKQKNYFQQPVLARFIKITAVSQSLHVSMRAGVVVKIGIHDVPKWIIKNTRVVATNGCIETNGCSYESSGCFIDYDMSMKCLAEHGIDQGYNLYGQPFTTLPTFYINNIPSDVATTVLHLSIKIKKLDSRTLTSTIKKVSSKNIFIS